MIQFGNHPSWSTWSAHSTSSGCSPQSATCALVMKKGRKDPKKDPKIPRKSVASLKRRKLRRHYMVIWDLEFFENRPTRKPSQKPQKTTKIRSWRVQIGPRPRPHKVRGLDATCFWRPEQLWQFGHQKKTANLCHVWAQAKQEVLVNRNLRKVIGVCMYVSTVNSMLQVSPGGFTLRFPIHHKMQTLFILCRSTKNPPFSSQIWSAETSPIRPNLNTLGNILRKMPHDAEVILGNSKGSKIEIIFIPLAKRFEKKTRKVPKRGCLNLFNL